MTEDEARSKAFDVLINSLRLDEFQKIAVREILIDLGDEIDFPNVTPEQEEKLMQLGAIVSEGMF